MPETNCGVACTPKKEKGFCELTDDLIVELNKAEELAITLDERLYGATMAEPLEKKSSPVSIDEKIRACLSTVRAVNASLFRTIDRF